MSDSKIIVQLINKDGRRAVVIEDTIGYAIERVCFEYPSDGWRDATSEFVATVPKKYYSRILALEFEDA